MGLLTGLSNIFQYCACRLAVTLNFGKDLIGIFLGVGEHEAANAASGRARFKNNKSFEPGTIDGLKNFGQMLALRNH